MISKNDALIFLAILSIFPLAISRNSTTCNRSCGNGTQPDQHVPYPFGFSPSCNIQLNCTPNGDVQIGEFPVRNITPNTILINLEAKCGRPIQTLKTLFGQNYAPTSLNGILLQNCTSATSRCTLPPTRIIETNFQSLGCNYTNSSVSCYSENKLDGFLSYENVTSRHCQFLLSSISIDSVNNSTVSLDVQVVQLGWWLEGTCRCSNDASCTQLLSPFNNGSAYRCRCNKGFIGDGYFDGVACREEFRGSTRVAVLIGGIIAGASGVIILGLICCYIRRRRSSLKTRKRANRRLCEATGISSIPTYPYKDIEKATNYFSEKQRLGTGAYGTVYSGKLSADEWVAIKRIKHGDTESVEQVMNEIKLISSVSHPNLVRLLGCSIDKGEQILVYEFMPNGTLSQHLQRTRGNGLPWPVRLTIATETAQAVAYLHSAINPPIYHRDIKSSNILLDYNYKAKVADFGLSRLGMMPDSSHISTAPQGTPGYLDPQYHQDFHLSDKSDVYSFGVVLVEIIAALKAVDFARPQSEVNLAALAVEKIGKGCLEEIIDPLLDPNRDAWTLSSVHKVGELAFRCLAFHRDMRPTMMEVADELKQIRDSRLTESEDNTCSASSQASCSFSSNLSEQPLSLKVNKPEANGLFVLQTGGDIQMNSMETLKDNSPVSVQDPWLSEHSSPSSNSLLGNVTR